MSRRELSNDFRFSGSTRFFSAMPLGELRSSPVVNRDNLLDFRRKYGARIGSQRGARALPMSAQASYECN